jgi:hypothetical protein
MSGALPGFPSCGFPSAKTNIDYWIAFVFRDMQSLRKSWFDWKLTADS